MNLLKCTVGSTLAVAGMTVVLGGCSPGSDYANAESSARVATTSAVVDASSTTGISGAGGATAVDATTNSDQTLPGPAGHLARLTEELGLTADQQAQAQTIFDTGRQAADTALSNAKGQVQALLTAEQAATLAEKLPPVELVPFGPGPRGGQPFGDRGPGFGGPLGPQERLDALANQVGLTDEQKAQIDTIVAKSRATGVARIGQARDAFRALLTADQLTMLNTVEQRRANAGYLHFFGFRPFEPHGPFNGPPALGGALNLTDDQKTQTQPIFDSLKTDLDTLRSSTKDQIHAVLTDEQAAQLDQLRASHPFHGGPGRGPLGAMRGRGPGFGGPRGLQAGAFEPADDEATVPDHTISELSLTDDQITQIETIIDDVSTTLTNTRDQARTDFRAILTADQVKQLDEIESRHHHE